MRADQLDQVNSTVKNKHPIHTGNYKIKTSIVEEAIKKIDEAIKFRIQGMIIYGPSGYGKSTAINIIKNEIYEKYDHEILTFVSSMPDPLKNTNVFYTRLLKATNHDLFNKGSAQDKSDRLCSQLINLALEENGNRKILFFIDEADALDKNEYQCLKDINNQLKAQSIEMTTILVGTEDLISQRNLFSGMKEVQIVRRFMQKTHIFNGIRTKKELQDVLGAYDFGMRFPLDSDLTYTNYFFPMAFSESKFLIHETENLYNCICNIYGKTIFSKHGLSMSHLCNMIEFLFIEHGIEGAGDEWITEDMWIETVKFADCGHEQDLLNACINGKRK
ncbi:ATP-binding protein [Acetobacterium wieringae]|uniref:ATP-binding protein n=1 Tax=Acetobacterium wieringae TaxID=52694 RepID=UPI00203398AC|nr:ATP-binding protein [Acetobacterium wieringae]URN85992.1 ATP-binding protein [Acetobacterium wieringae]